MKDFLKIFFILFLIFMILSLLIYFLSFNQKIYYKDFGNKDCEIKICLIAGVHGNEPAGSILFHQLIKNGYFEKLTSGKKIFIRVIPSVNEFGLEYNTRYQNSLSHPDINRTFTEEGEIHHLSRDLLRLLKEMTLVIDFHEAWGFHKIHPQSLGSSLTVTGDKPTYELSKYIVQNLNDIILNPKYQFGILKRICSIPNTLSCYLHKRGINYILVETSGQNDVQPLEVRQVQIISILESVHHFFLLT